MKRTAAMLVLGIFSIGFAEKDGFTFNAITFSEHYPRFEMEDYESPPEWCDSECVLTYEPDWNLICMDRFTFDGGGAYFSRIDSSVAITHTFAQEMGGDSLYPSWQFWRKIGSEKKFSMTRVIIDEFKMYHECGFLNMPWAEADPIIRHIVFEFMLSGDTTADWEDGDCYNASGMGSLQTGGISKDEVIPNTEKKCRLISPYDWQYYSLPKSVSSLMQTTGFRPTKLSPSFRISKLSPNRFSLDGLAVGSVYKVFDLNGNLLQRETWNGEAFAVERVPAVLRVQGKAYLLQ